MKNKRYDFLSSRDVHYQFLVELPKLIQRTDGFKILYSPKEFFSELLLAISQAYRRICLVALYLEGDQGGKKVFDALLRVKQIRPQVNIKVLVDWNRAQRRRFGPYRKSGNATIKNVDWYADIMNKYPHMDIPIYGIPINVNEVLGVLHLKGFIIDDQVLYSGASLSEEYLHVNDKYRYDRYHIIRNRKLSSIMLNYIDEELLSAKVTNKLGCRDSLVNRLIKRNNIRLLRRNLRRVCYRYRGNNISSGNLAIAPLVGLGKNSALNKVIYHLISSVKNKIVLCTPYFNMPNVLMCAVVGVLRQNKKVEIIVGDKVANDFFIPMNKPFALFGILPYLYEVNLRFFLKQLQEYIDNKQLEVRIWQEGCNGYHVKGIWVDDEWQLLTGNNLNPRALSLDLENALLIHDPRGVLCMQNNKELNMIRTHTKLVMHYTVLQKISDYPEKIGQLLSNMHKIRFDKLINRVL
ncbi:CDP-diacylglycerol--serine O-phosphatidyltransferase [Candidatus Blochmannia ocreatus (nom. nud.)]|uniref:CDP-diacylglycerol--serine O-phosphatidyltransferase n=1 Tax=Candidatus Blochmannia ocreatus (nom. nud.) TaxID=251538 RepID=A0ABY4SUF3_9ENTR|nr:CDP-diacylglycerol--serine O-phosphatidyltransferase [Candidatus Blochmannia ocreatus]URJ25029.1 CDP-diacylglycerol--serine O-phosphatidyltransferase [Candidatus Blochmannia ocreatus]